MVEILVRIDVETRFDCVGVHLCGDVSGDQRSPEDLSGPSLSSTAMAVSVTASRFHAAAVREPNGLAVGARSEGSCSAKLAAASLRSTRS